MTDADQTGAWDDLLAAARELLGEHADAAGLLRDIPVMQQALLLHEADRLERKLGAEHPRVVQLRERTQDQAQFVQTFESAVEDAQVRVAPVAEDTVLLHGRVVDENGRGVAGMAVSAEDEQGKALRSIGHAETNALGYFALPLTARAAEALAKAGRTQVALAVRAHGQSVRSAPVALKLARGQRTFAEVAVNRETFRGGRARGKGPAPDAAA